MLNLMECWLDQRPLILDIKIDGPQILPVLARRAFKPCIINKVS